MSGKIRVARERSVLFLPELVRHFDKQRCPVRRSSTSRDGRATLNPSYRDRLQAQFTGRGE
jgi:hypothetical protein